MPVDSPRGRGRPSATSHDEIRAVAMRLFAAQGYAFTSLAHIAREAGVSRTTLFSYFPAKRDLVWEELDQATANLPERFDACAQLPVVEAIAQVVAGLADTASDDRAVFAARWRIVQDDADLRATVMARTTELAEVIVGEVRRREPRCDVVLVDHITHALIAVVARCTAEWARGAAPGQSRIEYTTEGLRPLTRALSPLLDG